MVVSEPIQQQVNTAVQYQRAMTLDKDVVGDIIVPELPNTIHRPSFSIDGNGHVVRGFIRREVSSQAEADQAIEGRVFIRNVNFEKGGIILYATNGSKIEGCAFRNSIIEMRFCMHGIVEGAHFFGNSYHIIADGKWEGATSANSQSNSTVVRSSRHYCTKGQEYAVYVKDSSQVELSNCTYEGENPLRNVLADFTNGTNAQTFYIHKPHIENKPQIAAFDLATSSGLYKITDVWNQTCNKVLRVDGKSKAWYQIELSYPSLPAGSNGIIEMHGGAHERGFVKVICPKYAGEGMGYLNSLFLDQNKLPDRAIVN